MNINRSCGLLIHPTALPNKYGIGDFGKETYEFIDFLAELKQTYWQILPLTIPEKGNSPYSPLSTFAGNPLLISPDLLYEDGLLSNQDLSELKGFTNKIDYPAMIQEREKLLRKAFQEFSPNDKAYLDFCKYHWLDDYSLFITLYEKNNKTAWNTWALNEQKPSSQEKEKLINGYQKQIDYHKFVQFIFYKQWQGLKEYATKNKIQIIGDIPIYVSYNSADVWANKELFQLDENMQAKYISGCPPDGFNADGQIWENPLYDWEKNSLNSYKWWIERVRYNLEICHVLRLDHFIGFSRYWSIPADLNDARQGSWKEGPGKEIFLALQKAIPKLNIIAEDLGSLTAQVTQLKNEFNFPGMLVAQYALEDWDFDMNSLSENTFIYPGTHDNNTSRAWWNEYACNNDTIKKNLYQILREVRKESDILVNQDSLAYDLIELVYSSKCLVAIIPIQDILNLGQEFRMNRPGFAKGNWDIRIEKNYTELNKNDLLRLINCYKRGNL